MKTIDSQRLSPVANTFWQDCNFAIPWQEVGVVMKGKLRAGSFICCTKKIRKTISLNHDQKIINQGYVVLINVLVLKNTSKNLKIS